MSAQTYPRARPAEVMPGAVEEAAPDMGSPKSLHQALAKGWDESKYAMKPALYVLEDRVRGYLVQKFQRFIVSDDLAVSDAAKEIWVSIFPALAAPGREPEEKSGGEK